MDMDGYFRFALSLMLVIGMILLAAGLLKRYGNNGFRGFGKGGRKADRRLHILETLVIDPRRRLVLVRRDDAEHLLLLGGTTDTVVERGIEGPAAAQAPFPSSPALALGAPAGENGDENRP